MDWARILKAGAVYFALVFAVGFVLGVVRELLVVPRLGVRMAELLEMPLMLAASLLAARWTVRRYGIDATTRTRLGVGIVALALLLAAELGVAVGIRGAAFSEAFASRDAVSGAVYRIALIAFALMPLVVDRRERARPDR